jgi:uncharacterized membrane protein YeaQ/YmgE (transglycosylase-associated protein family)
VDSVQEWGALAFGLVVGWITYFVNRHRSGAVTLGDIAAIVGAVGGAAVLSLFPAGSDLFGAYGLGLAIGFFGYFAVLVVLVRKNKAAGWTSQWFLDGRRPMPPAGVEATTDRPMRSGAAGNIR